MRTLGRSKIKAARQTRLKKNNSISPFRKSDRRSLPHPLGARCLRPATPGDPHDVTTMGAKRVV